MRIAVTGASGFIGAHLLRAATAAGAEVVALVRSSAGEARVRAAGITPLRVGMEAHALAQAFAGADAVVHLAHVGSEREGQTYPRVNVEGTREVAAGARDAGVRRVVMLSGLGVARYGQAPRVTNPYFRSKLEAEQVLFGSGLQAVVFRPSYVLGAGDDFVPSLMRQARMGAIELPGDGAYRMQPVAAEDAAAAILAAARADAHVFFPDRPAHRALDLVGPEPLAVSALVERVAACAAALGAAVELRVRSVPVDEADRAAAAGGWHEMARDELDCLLCDEVADPAPLQALLGRTLIPVDEALRRAVAAALEAGA